mmetsp:Transcript_23383/g.53962  ORF Transcript_23383/g.53962 Transcript_23383/m.53962 type:complete len:206 (-) Transcript_23383:871-1488(-)
MRRNTSRNNSIKASTSSWVTVSGGVRRITLPLPAVRTKSPASCEYCWIFVHSSASGNTTPTSNPSPRTATSPRLANILVRPSLRKAPLCDTRVRNSVSLSTSNVKLAAAHTSGEPAKVLPWSPGLMCLAILSLTSTAPTGIPPARGLARVNISGTTPFNSYAKRCPVLPSPHWTSSKTRSAPTSLQRLRKACKNSVLAGMTPPSP